MSRDLNQPTYSITTAIDYANAPPHLGHAYEKIATDVAARFQRLTGKNVFFLTGTDEHGSKVAQTAAGKGLEPRAYVDQISDAFKAAWKHLDVAYDRFIRTTEADHYRVVASLWRAMAAKGDIYKASYTGDYCTGCEAFLTQRDLDETGNCKIHLRAPIQVLEENYFFKLSQYKQALINHIESHPEFVRPEFRRQEVLAFLETVEDISVSRSKKAVSWGIPVPDDPDQVIYVWIDALSNYVTGAGYLVDDAHYQQFWPADVHVIGKDILRFHAVYWPAMLLSAGLPLPKTVFAHGFITINDAKLSKSIGNVVSPFDLTERFSLTNPDPIRYYLMTCATFGQDGNFTEDDFKARVNADLANNLGNLLNRTLNMTQKYFDGRVPTARRVQRPDGFESIELVTAKIRDDYEQFSYQRALENILLWADGANKLINDSEPWNLFKNGDMEQLARVMYTVLDTLRQVALMASPVIPNLSQAIWHQLGYSQPLSDFAWGDIVASPLPEGQATRLEGPILPRLEDELVGSAKKK
jgi:methionyl-tRNA synthetase